MKRALAFAEGFTLIVAVTDSLEAQYEIQRHLWREGIHYQKAWVQDPDRPLLDQVEEHLHSRKMPVMVMGLEQLSTLQEKIEAALRHINWTRPQWVERVKQPIVFWVMPEFQTLLARQAPDMWRFRSLLVEFTLGLKFSRSRETELSWRLRHLDLAPRPRMFYLLELSRLRNSVNLAMEAVNLAVIHNLSLPNDEPTLGKVEILLLPPGAPTPGFSQLKNTPNLSSLNLVMAHVTDADLCQLKASPRLSSLNLSITKVSDGGLFNIKNFSNIHSLYLSGTEITDDGLKYLKDLTSLSKLVLHRTRVTDIGLAYISGLQSILSLNLAYTDVTDEGMKHLNALTNLADLSLAFTRVTNEGLRNLKDLVCLTTLFLDGTRVTDEVLQHLKALPALTELHVNETRISDEGLKVLAKFPHLRTLSVTHSLVTDKGKDEMRRNRPDLKLHR